MLSLPQPDPPQNIIELDDKVTETSKVVTAALNMCFDLEADLNQCDLFGLVIDFATKWEMDMVLKVLRQQISACLLDESTTPPFELLFVADKLQDYDIIALFIAKLGDRRAARRDEGPRQYPRSLTGFERYDDPGRLGDIWGIDIIQGASPLEPGVMDPRAFCQVRPMVHWALARAIHQVEWPTLAKRDWKKIGENFKAIMNEACKFQVSRSSD